MAGAPGFEPGNGGTKNRCLTAWRRPNASASRVSRAPRQQGALRAKGYVRGFRKAFLDAPQDHAARIRFAVAQAGSPRYKPATRCAGAIPVRRDRSVAQSGSAPRSGRGGSQVQILPLRPYKINGLSSARIARTTETPTVSGRRWEMAGWLCGLLLLLCPAGEVAGQGAGGAGESTTIMGRASVIDGDTLEIGGRPVRMQGIDAPESGQLCEDEAGKEWRCGQAAALALEAMIGGRSVTCAVDPRDAADRYGRALGWCSAGGQALSEAMAARAGLWPIGAFSIMPKGMRGPTRQPCWPPRPRRAPHGAASGKGGLTGRISGGQPGGANRPLQSGRSAR